MPSVSGEAGRLSRRRVRGGLTVFPKLDDLAGVCQRDRCVDAIRVIFCLMQGGIVSHGGATDDFCYRGGGNP